MKTIVSIKLGIAMSATPVKLDCYPKDNKIGELLVLIRLLLAPCKPKLSPLMFPTH